LRDPVQVTRAAGVIRDPGGDLVDDRADPGAQLLAAGRGPKRLPPVPLVTGEPDPHIHDPLVGTAACHTPFPRPRHAPSGPAPGPLTPAARALPLRPKGAGEPPPEGPTSAVRPISVPRRHSSPCSSRA